MTRPWVSPGAGWEAFEWFSRAVDGPMTGQALAMIPLIVVLLVYDPPVADAALLAIDYMVWAALQSLVEWSDNRTVGEVLAA